MFRTLLLSDDPLEAPQLAALLDSRFSVEGVAAASLPTDLGSAARCEFAVGAAFPEPWLRAAANLRHLVVPFAGIPRKLRDALGAAPQVEVYSSHYNAVFVAEHAWALLLAASKRIVVGDRTLRGGDWSARHSGSPSWILRDRTLLVVGYGAIGREVARMASGFGMRVMAVRRRAGAGAGEAATAATAVAAANSTRASDTQIECVGGPEYLLEYIREADAIVVALPETASTIGVLGREAFSRMKDGVLLVNVGRGSALDEEAFVEAIQSGKIGAAGIDAWWVYPESEAARASTSPSRTPLAEFQNLVFSPHRASDVLGHDEAQLVDVARILRQIADGSPPLAIDRAEWY